MIKIKKMTILSRYLSIGAVAAMVMIINSGCDPSKELEKRGSRRDSDFS